MTPSIMRDVDERLERLDLPFNRDGIDPLGVSKAYLRRFLGMLGWFHRHYFSATVRGLHHVPTKGRVMLICNHSGGLPLDGGMIIASCFFGMDPPRLVQGMVDKFMSRLPFAGEWTSRVGQMTGLPEHAVRLLDEDRMLMVFPEGARGTEKLFPQRYSLVRFGTGFMRLALQTHTPIVPMAFLGAGEAVPTILNLYKFGRMLGAPYFPVTPYLLPLPLPVSVDVHFGEPIDFEGTGAEEDATIAMRVQDVKSRVETLIRDGIRMRA